VGVTPDILLKPKDGKLPEMQHEEDLKGALKTSDVSNKNCKYSFELPDGHLETAYDMIKAMELELAEEKQAKAN
jgi:hypothetical protein